MLKNKRVFRILICSTALSFGGEQKQISKAISHLDKERFQLLICCIRPHGYVEPGIKDSGTEIIGLGIQGRYNVIGAVKGLCRVIKQNNIDLIHMGIFGSEFAGIIASILTRVPVVAVLTTTYDVKERLATSTANRLSSRLKWWVICGGHAVLSRMAKVRYIAYSTAIKTSAVKNLHLPERRIEIVPLGIDPRDFDDSKPAPEPLGQLRDDLGIDGAYPVLLNVARLASVKGQRELIETMPRVLEYLPKARLLIAGDGPLQDELGHLKDRLGLQKHVFLMGRRDDIADLLKVSDIFVFTSYYEGLPNTVVEAMAAGKPAVAFDIPALREVIEDRQSGLLVKGRDKRLFADAIIEVAEQKRLAAKMGERGRQIATNRYDIRHNIKLLEKSYVRILSGR